MDPSLARARELLVPKPDGAEPVPDVPLENVLPGGLVVIGFFHQRRFLAATSLTASITSAMSVSLDPGCRGREMVWQ